MMWDYLLSDNNKLSVSAPGGLDVYLLIRGYPTVGATLWCGIRRKLIWVTRGKVMNRDNWAWETDGVA